MSPTPSFMFKNFSLPLDPSVVLSSPSRSPFYTLNSESSHILPSSSQQYDTSGSTSRLLSTTFSASKTKTLLTQTQAQLVIGIDTNNTRTKHVN